MIKRIILRHPKHKRGLENLQKIQKNVNALKIYVAAYEHRKRMISKAIEAHGQQYFAKPYVATSEIKEVIEQLEKRRIRTKSKPKNLSKEKRHGKKRERDNK